MNVNDQARRRFSSWIFWLSVVSQLLLPVTQGFVGPSLTQRQKQSPRRLSLPELHQKKDADLVESLKGAATQAGQDFFVALRWGAANALTSALPDQQRKELMDRLDPEEPGRKGPDKEDEEVLFMKNSVNEAVAAALAEESQREQTRWEKEKEEILEQAEDAAKKRVANEIKVQQQRMEQEKQRLLEETEATKRRLELEQQAKQKELETEKKVELERLQKELEAKLEVKGVDNLADSEAFSHAVLGPTIRDFGYKRIHTVSATDLSTIPVWRKQRVYRHNRAKSMANDKLKTMHLGLPGVICLHEQENGKLSIIDGQHRVGMMKILLEKQQEDAEKTNGLKTMSEYIDLDNVLVEVYPENPAYRSNDHAEDIFLEINKAEPVKLVDMPGVASAKDRNMISKAVAKLENDYSTMFSPSQRCRVPNVNVDNLRDNVFAANIIKRHNMKTIKQLHEWIAQQNKDLGARYEKDSNLRKNINDKAWKKAHENKFYLGLESSWLYK